MDQLLLGVALGFGAGIAPGPLLGLVIANTLKHGWGAGVRLALVPVIGDAPMIALCLSVLNALPSQAVAVIGELGGLLLFYIAFQTVRDARQAVLAAEPEATGRFKRSRHHGLIMRGVLIDYINPHPWLFWIGIGGPVLVTAWRAGAWRAGVFLIAFYVFIVGTKIALAGVVALGRTRLTQRWYRLVLTSSGGLLAAAGVALIADFWSRAW